MSTRFQINSYLPLGTMKQAIRAILASLSMYTRLPAWRIMPLDRADYSRGVEAFPLVGLVTGSALFGVFYIANELLGFSLVSSVLMALIARMLLTGAFHEDGLGDFFDGFGGGKDKASILRIMKDSHVGSYAVLGYIMYYSLLVSILVGMRSDIVMLALFTGDILGKSSVVFLIDRLSYARDAEASKVGIVYSPSRLWILYVTLLLSLTLWLGRDVMCVPILITIACALLFNYVYGWYIKRKIGGYTGDTCGALMLLTELQSIVFLFILLS